jgi:hypothetical protein
LRSMRRGELGLLLTVEAEDVVVEVATRRSSGDFPLSLCFTADLSIVHSVASAASMLADEIRAEHGYLVDEIDAYNCAYEGEPVEVLPSVDRARVYRWAGFLDAALRDCDAVLVEDPSNELAKEERAYAVQAHERRYLERD